VRAEQMFRTCIATVSLSGDLHEKVDAIAAAGFDGIEIFETDLLAYPAAPAEVGRMINAAGLKLVMFQPFRDFEGLPEPHRSRAFDRAERKFDVMGALGTDLMLVCSNVSPAALGGIQRAADDLRELGERAAKRGLRIGFEALAWGRHVFDHRDAWEIVRRADHPAVGIILDSFHTLARGIDPASIRQIPGDRILNVHVADAPPVKLDMLTLSRHFRNMPGQGALDVTGFLAAVQATGYDGYLSLEIFNDEFRSGSARQVAVDGRRSLIATMDEVAHREPSPASKGTGRTTLPRRGVPSGVDFIEFAADDWTAPELAALLAGLGFARAERHPSKNIERWQQGSISLVINADREGFAHGAFILHGPCACAIGLRVADVEASVSRAEALLAERISYQFWGGTTTLPALRGVGASLLCLAGGEGAPDREDEKHPGAHAFSGAGLVSIDHVSLSMNYEDMLSAVLFYTSIFAFERTSELDVADPGGLVQSQVVETASGSVRIALNGSRSYRTMSGRFLREFFGSGVQHVAFATADIFTTAKHLKATSVPILPIHENYYEDLQARFGLESEFVDRLKHANILYDTDEHGEYFQLYTTPFADRFFFEVVERRNGYRGFGAANAPIRLAAQSRLAKLAATTQ